MDVEFFFHWGMFCHLLNNLMFSCFCHCSISWEKTGDGLAKGMEAKKIRGITEEKKIREGWEGGDNYEMMSWRAYKGEEDEEERTFILSAFKRLVHCKLNEKEKKPSPSFNTIIIHGLGSMNKWMLKSKDVRNEDLDVRREKSKRKDQKKNIWTSRLVMGKWMIRTYCQL